MREDLNFIVRILLLHDQGSTKKSNKKDIFLYDQKVFLFVCHFFLWKITFTLKMQNIFLCTPLPWKSFFGNKGGLGKKGDPRYALSIQYMYMHAYTKKYYACMSLQNFPSNPKFSVYKKKKEILADSSFMDRIYIYHIYIFKIIMSIIYCT